MLKVMYLFLLVFQVVHYRCGFHNPALIMHNLENKKTWRFFTRRASTSAYFCISVFVFFPHCLFMFFQSPSFLKRFIVIKIGYDSIPSDRYFSALNSFIYLCIQTSYVLFSCIILYFQFQLQVFLKIYIQLRKRKCTGPLTSLLPKMHHLWRAWRHIQE